MIQRIQIHGYKSLRDLDVSLGQLNVFIGRNNAGKSNIIDALRFITQGLLSGISQALASRGGFGEVYYKGPEPPGSLRIELDLNEPGIGKTFHYQLELEGGPAYLAVRSESLGMDGSEGSLFRMDFGRGEIRNEDGSSRGPFSVAQVSSLFEAYRPQDWIGMRFYSGVTGILYYNLMPPLMKLPAPVQKQYFLNEYGDNFSAWIHTLRSESPALRETIMRLSAIFPELEDVLSPIAQDGRTMVAVRERGLTGHVISANLSDGLVRLLGVLTAPLAPGWAGTLCIEEPESAIHPRAIEFLVEEARSLATVGQVLATTHSRELVDYLKPDEVFTVVKDPQRGTQVSRLDSNRALELRKKTDLELGELWYSGALDEKL